jgi:hypothetical protein
MKKMSKIDALSVAYGALQELARCGNDECEEASHWIDKILTQTIKANARSRKRYKQLDKVDWRDIL